MAQWFWYFLIYSFLGCCLEKLYARCIRSPKRVRKSFLLLPLCPVYGLGMTALLALWEPGMGPLVLACLGALVCTGVEYLVHLFYEKTLKVRFWDYTGLPGSVQGRICPRFAAVWGGLSAFAAVCVQPWVAVLAAAVPPALSYGMWLLLAADCVLTVRVLAWYHDTELLALSALSARVSSQSSTS